MSLRNFLFFSLLLLFSTLTVGQSKEGLIDGKLIYKMKQQYSKAAPSSLFQPFLKDNNWFVRQKFPNHAPLSAKSIKAGEVDLSRIYELDFGKEMDPIILSRKLLSTGQFEYVEPIYKQELTYVPSDTLKNKQYYLDLIEAYQAWNINKGDTNVVIAIVDTGLDTDHPDIVDNLFYNYNDPINGLDDDSDGYVDNYLGWDVANNDNDVGFEVWGHGTNVAGIASASTDNVTGISGIGFSCKILPIKIDDYRGFLVNAYEGIVYAADHGADIINNSWGGYQSSAYNQDVIDYASSKGVLVVAAVGNDSTEMPFYPAAYENVLSVGASEQQDLKKNSSNYGHWVDVFAPGEAMFTLNTIGGYTINGGTSMASPVVAGIAGLVKSQYPLYSPKQLAHKIMGTTDNIDHLNSTVFSGKLGTGRVNAFKALDFSSKPGIEMHNIQISKKIFKIGDSVEISGEFTNYLSPASNVNIQLLGNNSYFEFLKASVNIGTLDSLETKNNLSNPFLLKVKPGVPINTMAEIKISITADNYSFVQYISLKLNPDFINIDHNLISTTLTSRGRIGYNDFSSEEGIGFHYKDGASVMYAASFMIGNSGNSLADMFRSDGSGVDTDFSRISKIVPVTAKKANYEYQCIFNDANLNQPLGLEITQRNFVFDTTTLNKHIFFVYHVKNTSAAKIKNLYAGIISDWDILDFSRNKAYFHPQSKMGIAFNSDSNLYFGIKLLSKQNVNHYAIDNLAGGNGGVDLTDGFSDAEKFTVLSTSKDSAGMASVGGNDILDLVSAGPVDIMPDSTVSFAFVLLASESLNELIASAQEAQQSYEQLALGVKELQLSKNLNLIIAPNPGKEDITIKFTVAGKQSCKLNVYDSAGQLVLQKDYGKLGKNNYEKNISLNTFRSGIYFLELLVGNKKIQDKFAVVK